MKQLLFSLKEGSVSYHKKEILKELDINIHRKDFIALVGKNGAGKSTLMNVISGQHDIDAGEKWSIDNFAVNYFNQNFVLNDDNNTVEQEILSVIKNQDNNYEIDIFCNNLSIDKKSLIKHLSGGQKRRVGLIKNLIKPSDLLLLDEPTNHLDLDTIVWLENYLKKLDCAILCVSHDRQFLKNFTNKILWIDRSKIKINYKGYSDFDNWSETLLSQEERELQNRKQFVNLEVNWANKGVKARVKRNTRRLEQAKDLKENLDKDISEFKKATKKIEINEIFENSKNFKNVATFLKFFEFSKISLISIFFVAFLNSLISLSKFSFKSLACSNLLVFLLTLALTPLLAQFTSKLTNCFLFCSSLSSCDKRVSDQLSKSL